MTGAPASHRLKGRSVLVVEDEFLVAAMLADVLEDAGAVVVGPAPSLGDGVTLALRGGIDCAVIDWNLGGEHSDPLARVLMGKGVPFVIASGYHALPEEFACHPRIGKPFDLGKLVTMLGELIDPAL